MKQQINIKILLLLFVLICALQSKEKLFSFVSSPDWHIGEAYIKSAEVIEKANRIQDSVLMDMKKYSPQFIMIAGDLIDGDFKGHWYHVSNTYNSKVINQIHKDADICYGGLKKKFSEHGITTIIAAVGDHEVGDNDWGVNSVKSHAVKDYRAAFQKHFLQTPQGTWLYPDNIGSVAPRPTGTLYEGTSYAVKFQNLLVISIDQYRQDSPTKKLNNRTGTIIPDVEGKHLEWFENILKAARSDPSIKFMIVQGHAPIIGPVRKKSSSGMLFEKKEQSSLWQLMKAYNVDLYFAGEVHTHTASKEANSNLVQLVHGAMAGNENSYNYIVTDVFDNKLELTLRIEKFDQSKPYFVNAGTLTIDKSGAQPSITATGELSLVDPKGLIIHYDFESAQIAINYGYFGQKFYNGTPVGVTQTTGVLGKAYSFNGNAKTTTFGEHPIGEAEPRTISTWVKLNTINEGTISGSGKTLKNINGVYDFRANNGKLRLYINAGNNKRFAEANQNTIKINDNVWHHVGLVLPGKSKNKLSQVLFYIDGKEYSASTSNPNAAIYTHAGMAPYVIGKAFKSNGPGFVGHIDDYGLWSSALNPAMMSALYHVVSETSLKYNVHDMDQLFALYRNRSNCVVTIDQRDWQFKQGLTGSPGRLISYGNNGYHLILDNSGNGLATVTSSTTIDQFNKCHISQVSTNSKHNSIVIKFSLNQVTHITCDLFNLQGRKLMPLIQNRLKSGVYTFNINAIQTNGTLIPNGMYIVILKGDAINLSFPLPISW